MRLWVLKLFQVVFTLVEQYRHKYSVSPVSINTLQVLIR